MSHRNANDLIKEMRYLTELSNDVKICLLKQIKKNRQ